MRIAITGASGFLGRHVLAAVTQWHARPSHEPPAWKKPVDGFLPSRPYIVATARRLRSELPQYPGVRWVPLDLAALPADPFERLGRPDVLVHLAWEGLPNYHSPWHLQTELPRHRRFLQAVAQTGQPAMLVAGTCAEYGMQQGCLSEAMPARPAHAYAVAKDALRHSLNDLVDAHGVATTWLRIFYLFGPGQPARTLYGQLMQAIDRGDTAFDMSSGDQVRDYMPVQHAAAVVAALGARLARGCPGDGIVNLASGRPRRVRSLAEQWARAAGSSIRLNRGVVSALPHEPPAFWGDTTKLERLVRTEPSLIERTKGKAA